MKRIIVVGGGAGGLELVTKLGDKFGRKKRAEVMLIDQNTEHLWKPLLHEIATGALNDQTDHISYLSQAQHHHFSFKQGKMINIDRDNKRVVIIDTNRLALGYADAEVAIDYDALVIAIGCTSNDFGTPGVKENAIFLDDQKSAIELRKLLLSTFVRFDIEANNSAPQSKIKIAIVGGGATGIELASELTT